MIKEKTLCSSQGITFRRVGVPTANDIVKSSSKDAVRWVIFRARWNQMQFDLELINLNLQLASHYVLMLEVLFFYLNLHFT